MRKGAYLEVTLHDPAGSPASAIQRLVGDRLTGEHGGLSIRVLGAGAEDAGPQAHRLVLYVEGEQPAPEDFKRFATDAVQRLWAGAGGAAPVDALAAGTAAAPGPRLLKVDDWEGYDTASAAAAPAGAASLAVAALAEGCLAPVTGGAPVAGAPLPADAARPRAQSGVFDACPAGGDGSDAEQNTLKNRTDVGHWRATTVGAILALPVPANLSTERRDWSADDRAAIGRYEGLPLQVAGYLAGARPEGPESCNCHSVSDVDYHLWLVDASGTGRAASVVSEVTPRLRARHAGWTIERLCALVSGQTRVRISGWLMMDPLHPDQVGQTRGTTWEIHPIVAIDVDQNGKWVALDNVTA